MGKRERFTTQAVVSEKRIARPKPLPRPPPKPKPKPKDPPPKPKKRKKKEKKGAGIVHFKSIDPLDPRAGVNPFSIAMEAHKKKTQ